MSREILATSEPSTQIDSGESQTLYLGLDEAGYGPNLGPLVVAATAFVGPDHLAGDDWWIAFARFISRHASRNDSEPIRLVVDDSKRVLALSGGFDHLERTVRVFLEHGGTKADRLERLLAAIDLAGAANLEREHWFRAGTAGSMLPVEPALLESVSQWPARPVGIRCRAVFPAEFNQRLGTLPTKADVELECVRALLTDLLADSAHAKVARIVVWIDRLGGRRYYRTLVEDLAADEFVLTIEEGPSRSHYRFPSRGREVEIAFEVKGDGRRLPVALASMVAKYIRERSMAGFNAFWLEHCPDLKPTAGYPQDAKRFLKVIEPLLARLGVTKDELWRSR